MKRLASLLLFGLFLGGCSVTAHIAGHTDDYAESFRGTSQVDLASGGGQVEVLFDRTGISCSGATYRYYNAGGPGDKSRGDLKCSDGRTLHVENLRTEFKGGVGEGSDEYGIKGRWRYNLSKTLIDSYYEEVKRKVRESGLGVEHILAKKKITVAKAKPPAPPPAPEPARDAFPSSTLSVSFQKGPARPDDIAVIIGNADYSKLGRDIPDVVPAYADAAGFKRYVKVALGVSEDNIIFLKDATQKDMVGTFGNSENFKGRLYRYITPGKSRVFVYYSGHGAPGDKGVNFLVPADAEASLIELNGYPLNILYQNLSKLPAKSITVVLEACFSGLSEGGSVIKNASPVFLKAKNTGVPPNITVISAGAANQIASWDEDKSNGLFSKFFLKGMSGEADENKDKKVSWDELRDYLGKTMSRLAMRYYGREQTAQITVGGAK